VPVGACVGIEIASWSSPVEGNGPTIITCSVDGSRWRLPEPGTGIGGTYGPLEMGNTIIKGFVNSRRTHFIYQPAIGSFYEGGQYSFKEVLSARDPWSGWIHYDAGLDILRFPVPLATMALSLFEPMTAP